MSATRQTVLFLDWAHRVKIPFGVKLTIEKARKSAPCLVADRAWEKTHGAWRTVIRDNGSYRCWSQVHLTDAAKEMFPPEIGEYRRGDSLAYAESADGIRWEKPALGLYSFSGEPTNILGPYGQETAVFRDDSAAPEERYKCFDWDRMPGASGDFWGYGLYGCVSPDGLRWTRLQQPLLPYPHDTENVACWDPLLKKYVGYFRGHLDGRAIARSETQDFRHWPPAQVILYPGPEDKASDDYYTTCFTAYPDDPSLRFLFPAIYHHDSDQLDVRLAVSRNDLSWNWVARDPIIENGRPGEWDSGSVYAVPNMVHLPDGSLALAYSGSAATHNENSIGFGLAWAIWDDGRLAGIEVDSFGEFWSSGPFEPPNVATGDHVPFSGTQIEINARTRGMGRVEVELEEPDDRGGKPFAGYAFADCVPFRGDSVWEPLRWNGKNDLSELTGKQLVLHFRLSHAKVFGYRFA